MLLKAQPLCTLMSNQIPEKSFGWSRKKLLCRAKGDTPGSCLEKLCASTPESPLDCKEIKPVHPKGNQSWIFIGRTYAEASILWPPDSKSRLIRKDPDAGKEWRQEEKGVTEDEMVGWHHRLNGHEFEQVPGDGEGLGSLACCSQWGSKESDTTEWLNNNSKELNEGFYNHGSKVGSLTRLQCEQDLQSLKSQMVF